MARTARGDGHSAIRPPRKTTSAPIQIQVTIGDTSRRKVAAGGSSAYERTRPRSASARKASRSAGARSPSAAANTSSPSFTRGSSLRVSGATDTQTSRRRPAFRPTSLVASPSKKRDTGPSIGPADGKNERSVFSVVVRRRG